jgi:hypothetical protein
MVLAVLLVLLLVLLLASGPGELGVDASRNKLLHNHGAGWGAGSRACS